MPLFTNYKMHAEHKIFTWKKPYQNHCHSRQEKEHDKGTLNKQQSMPYVKEFFSPAACHINEILGGLSSR